MKKVTLPNLAIVIVALACFVIDFHFKNWEKLQRVIEHDVHWYYGYLPLIFIYDDIKIEKSNYQFAEDYYLVWTVPAPGGKRLLKTTYGLAVFYAPFFFMANAYAHVSNYETNGFSEPYKVFLLMSAIFFLIAGLDFLKKILRYFNFSEWVTAATILLIGLGTNLLCYASQSAPGVHVYNFFLIAMFIYYTIQWHNCTSWKNTIMLALTFGFISLIRPTNALIALFFLLYNVATPSACKQKFIFFKTKILHLLLIAFLTFIVWLPQFIYWKIATGNYVYYSYNNERFFWTEPKILDGLFSFRKGWLLYAPMLGFALLGIFFMKEELKKLQPAIILFLILNIYIIFSWWCWWYGGCFGQRSMVDSYALLAIPFASFIQFVFTRNIIYKILFSVFVSFFIWLNIFQTFQFELFSLHWDGMTRELYFKQFGKLNKINDFDKYLDYPNYEIIQTGNSANSQSADEPVKNTFSKKTELTRNQINLKAFNGKFVCDEGAKNHIVVANRDEPYRWETFTLIMFDDNECGLRTYNNFFLSAELNHSNEITAMRPEINYWETFTIIELENNFVAFKAVNEKYFSVDEKTLQIFANAGEIGEKEKFEMIFK